MHRALLRTLLTLTTTLLTAGVGSGATYYVSNQGSDKNDGQSPTTAWATLARVNAGPFRPGDNVLFRRNDTWRGQLVPHSGSEAGPITYGAYGDATAPKPRLLGSTSRNKASDWQDMGDNLWSTIPGAALKVDVGNIIFNQGQSCGVKKWSRKDLRRQGDFWYDESNRTAKVYSTINPASRYSDIELALKGAIIQQGNRSYVTYQGLDLHYGDYGIGGGDTRHITVRDCDLAFLGGALLFRHENGTPVRAGNGIEFWGNAHDCLVERCRLWEIYDAALTNQNMGAVCRQYNIVYRYNVIWNCEYSFEYWNRPQASLTHHIYFENNTCFNAGHGWGHSQRPDPAGRHLCFYTNDCQTHDIYIRNNIFCRATDVAFDALWWKPETMSDPGVIRLDHNCWLQPEGQMIRLQGKSYTQAQFAAYQRDTGQEAHSLAADPGLTDPAKLDFHLRPGSPCLGAGADFGHVADFDGRPIARAKASAIGAFEPPQGPSGQVLYVSPKGNDAWSGRLPAPNEGRTDGPLASITKARDAIRQMKAKQGGLKEAVTVQIRGGTYRLAEAIALEPEDSGTKQCPVSYVAYPGETPVLSGAKPVAGWKPYRGKIECAVLPEVKAGKWYFRSLFADGQRQIRARYPNVDPADPCRKGFLHTRRGKERLTVGGLHNVGDTLDYEVQVPAAGEYAVWLRYSHGMNAYQVADMGGRTSLVVDGGKPTPLTNLPDSGGWETYRWGRAAALRLTAGKHALRWRNNQGGAYGMDAFVLSDDPAWTPSGSIWPSAATGRHLVVVEAEDFVRADGPQLAFGITDFEPLPKDQKTSFPYGPGDVKPSWAEAPDAEVHIWPAFDACRGYKQITRLAKIDAAARTVTISGPECVTQLGIGDRYFVENVLEELDSPGEWYLDRQAGMLYYWPKQALTKVEVAAPVTGRLLQFEGDETKGQTLRHVRLSGLTFTQTDYSPDDGCVGYSVGNNGVAYLRGAVGCAIENCRFVGIGKNAVYLDGGRENVISGNDISDSAEGGVCLSKSSANTISDNHIHDLGKVYKHVGGVVTGGSDNVVSHNLIHDTTRWAITFGATGTGTVVEYNEVYNTSLETYDTGGIMAYQDDRKFNCKAVIRYNLVHDGVGYSSLMGKPIFDSRGIYIDGFSSGYTVTHNISYRNSASGGIFVQGGHDVRMSNNIIADNGGPQYLHTNFMKNGANIEFTRNIVCGPDCRMALMWIYDGGEKLTRFGNNTYWHPKGNIGYPVAGTWDAWQRLGLDAHSVLADPRFVNPKAGDYSLQPDSPALKLGFEPIDVSRIGLLRKRCSCPRAPAPWGVGGGVR